MIVGISAFITTTAGIATNQTEPDVAGGAADTATGVLALGLTEGEATDWTASISPS